MGDIRLNTTFVVLLVVTLVLFTVYFIIFSIDTEEKDYGNFEKITGRMQSFEVYHGEANIYQPTKRVSERYNDKYFEYLWGRYESSVKSEKEKHEEEKCTQKLGNLIQFGVVGMDEPLTSFKKRCEDKIPNGFEMP